MLSLTFPLLISSSGYLLSKGYEFLFLKGNEKIKTEQLILEEEFYKSIEEQVSLCMTQIYTQCNNNFYAKEQVYKKFNKMGTCIDYSEKDINLEKEKLINLKVILEEDNELLKKLCAKKVMISYFNDYNSKSFIILKEFFKTNLVTLITMLGTSVIFLINKMPIDMLSLLISSSFVGLSYGFLLNKSNNDSFNVYENIKEKLNLCDLEKYKTFDDIECKISLLCAEISKIKTMIEEEKEFLEEKTIEKTDFNKDYSLIDDVKISKEKSFKRTRKQ